MEIYKKNYYLFYLILLTIFIVLFSFGFLNYNGNKLNYISFSLISFYLIYFSFRKDSNFFETFFGIFLWLGFWFKFTMIIGFSDGIFREGSGLFDYKSNSFDNVIQTSQIGILGFIFSGFFRQKYLFKYPRKIKSDFKFNNFSKNRRLFAWIIFLIFCCSIALINIFFQIYQRGLIPLNNYNFILSGIIKWLLLFGLSSIAAVFIFLEINSLKKIYFFSLLLVFLESLFSYTSMLSRGMIFNSSSILYSSIKYIKTKGILINLKLIFKSILILFALFYFSVILVNEIRSKYFYKGLSNIETKKKNFRNQSK